VKQAELFGIILAVEIKKFSVLRRL